MINQTALKEQFDRQNKEKPKPRRRKPSGGSSSSGDESENGKGRKGKERDGLFETRKKKSNGAKLKLHLPDFYDGDKTKLERFFRQLDTWFILQSDAFPDDLTKILWTLSMMKGPHVDARSEEHTSELQSRP